MEEKIIKSDLLQLRQAYHNIQKAISNLNEVEGLDEEYKTLHAIAEDINDARISKEVDLEIFLEE